MSSDLLHAHIALAGKRLDYDYYVLCMTLMGLMKCDMGMLVECEASINVVVWHGRLLYLASSLFWSWAIIWWSSCSWIMSKSSSSTASCPNTACNSACMVMQKEV